MLITCKRDTLFRNLSVVQKAVATRGTLPILSNILLEAKKKSVRVMATDLEMGIEAYFEAEVEEEGSITFPARHLLEIIRKLPSSEVQISVERGTQILIRSAKALFSLAGLPAEEFPMLPEIRDGQRMDIKPNQLRVLIEETSFACSRDDPTHPEQAGVLLSLQAGRIIAVSTDGSRLAMREIRDNTGAEPPYDLLIPGRALEELLRLMDADGSGDMEILIGNNQVEFRLAQKKLVTRKIQARFPNWERVLPVSYQLAYIVETAKFTDALERAQLLAKLANNRLYIESRGRTLTIKATAPEVGEVSEELDWVEGCGDFSEGYSARYMIEGMRNIHTPYTFVGYAGKDKPFVIMPTDRKKPDAEEEINPDQAFPEGENELVELAAKPAQPEYLYLTMPLR